MSSRECASCGCEVTAADCTVLIVQARKRVIEPFGDLLQNRQQAAALLPQIMLCRECGAAFADEMAARFGVERKRQHDN